VLWQFANAAGVHPTRFGQMRDFGPLRTARFDPHPEPASAGSGELVCYAAHTLLTAVAERFQHNRELRRADPHRPTAYAWFPTRDLSLIDFTGPGAVALGAAHALSGYRNDVTRRWARAIRAAWPDIDGLLYSSSMTGEPCLALWAPATDTFPSAPQFSRGIDVPAPEWQDALRAITARLNYDYA
jgi:hypothetical protein